MVHVAFVNFSSLFGAWWPVYCQQALETLLPFRAGLCVCVVLYPTSKHACTMRGVDFLIRAHHPIAGCHGVLSWLRL